MEYSVQDEYASDFLYIIKQQMSLEDAGFGNRQLPVLSGEKKVGVFVFDIMPKSVKT